MLVLITEINRRNHVEHARQLCETHGREEAERLKVRWPAPHEHSVTAWESERKRWKYEIRVRPSLEGVCDLCTLPTEAEINAIYRGEDRERGDDDGVEYADPRDEQEERRNG